MLIYNDPVDKTPIHYNTYKIYTRGIQEIWFKGDFKESKYLLVSNVTLRLWIGYRTITEQFQ